MSRKQNIRWIATAIACGVPLVVAACGGNSDSPVDPDTAADQRAASLVAQMTTDEKIGMVHGTGVPNQGLGGPFPTGVAGAGYIPGVPRLGIPGVAMADSSGGVNVANVGATALPSTLALAASWDPQLANAYGARTATELRALGYAEGLGGGVNLAREPRDGRTFEFMGEDPVLSGTLSAARTNGTQAEKVIATIKHFAMNDQETNRSTSNSIIDERTMRETELLAFEIGVKQGQPGSVMCSYNLVNGTHACENPYLLTTVLQNEWGFKGVVQSDWFANHSTVAAALAGLDEEEPGDLGSATINVPGLDVTSYFSSALKAAVTAGSVPMSRLNDMVQRKLRTMIRHGVFDSPPTPGGSIDQMAGNAFALQVAQQSAVLLKNATQSGAQQPVLPLNAPGLSSIVVIGGHADVGVLSGGGSGGVPAINGNAVTGCPQPSPLYTSCATWYKSAPLAAIAAKAPNAKVTYFDGTDANAAASAAAQADVAIVFATQWEQEGVDLTSLRLPDNTMDPSNQSYDQNALIAAVATTAKRVIVVLENGSPVLMPWAGNVHAVLEAWYPGVQGGQAIADLLFGDVNPSGKLPITFPQQDADLPQPVISATDMSVNYSEGLLMGYRWYDAKQIQPLFPFGFGLSYTTFSYSGMSASANRAGNVTVTFTIQNKGSLAGAEIAQVYATLPAGLGEPPKRLVGWQKVILQPGQSQLVGVSVPAMLLSTWDATNHVWKLNGGAYQMIAGTSSRDTNALTASVSLSSH
ncbi:beta-glucosidase family protein [Paraburkholderia nemoris]|uniref:Thermostable beta-glucosidase B n=1 Tax=Paraburkholderia nemoris TaxID=2793076 RepID=A0ABM8QXU6_9BURK|nr:MULTISPECIES: glycoside hydrolase family 3 C-terminal domain-containing protein [Paraburkholderia]MBK3810037.1 beta-glucosidase [Paraburkholderia aspalathi]CAE6722220.1 Thermostable beta-glucosidase B [Paraburkholderia nemoris]CAE6750903.1 Thermostable beta-glucosidase B [Paraburkholderia nemoris]